ncbi:MAG: EAL domain-containing protein, partial [Bacilli bacterium]|nr:EAL domain-containing protein [Bacilli bacterium]
YDQQLESTLLDIVHLHHIEPKQLLLEITESAYTNDAKGIINSIKHLRSDGFKIEMDDFGTGYSSLNMVSNLPIDVLKIDREFIIHMCTSDKDKKMVEILLNISDLLGVSVVAEGVETKEQFDMLKKMGCDIIQGFYFSKPLPADQFAKLIEEEVKNSGHN